MKEIGYSELEALFTAALASLESRKAFINSLNVFPVPDGDTGTNMSLTLRTALEEVQKNHPKSMKEFVSTLSGGIPHRRARKLRCHPVPDHPRHGDGS